MFSTALPATTILTGVKLKMRKTIDFINTPSKVRTCDPRFRKPVLYEGKHVEINSLSANSVNLSVADCSRLIPFSVCKILLKIKSQGAPSVKPYGSYDPHGFFIWNYAQRTGGTNVRRFRSEKRR